MKRPNDEELGQLQQIADEQSKSPEVDNAHIVTFGGHHHVHIDLKDGDIIVTGINQDEAIHIKLQRKG